jgi:hypothetical protein
VQFSRTTIPDLPSLGLDDQEQALIQTLRQKSFYDRAELELAEAYYLGEQIVQNLRIAVPRELEFLRTIVGWPAIAVDPLVERLAIDGFRLPTSTDADGFLMDLWQENNGDSEQALAFTDALAMGRSYLLVGTNPDGEVPLLSVESPLNLTVLWDLRGRLPRAAMQEYWQDGRQRGALILPNKTVHLAENDSGAWEIVDRDDHDFGFVPVTRMANRPRTNNRDGRSEISPALRSITDAACRTLLGLEVAREIYSAPRMILMGVAEDAFQNSDGTPKAAWDTYITRVLAMERDENGDLPNLEQMQAYDPATFTRLIDMYASQASGMLAATPQDLGLYTEGNPVSAEAAQAAELRRNRRAVLKQRMFGDAMVAAMQHVLRFMNGGNLPDQYARFTADWASVSLEPMGTASDGMAKQIAAGAVPAESDVVLKRLGYSAVERARLEQDRRRSSGRQAAQAVVDAVTARANGATSADAGI